MYYVSLFSLVPLTAKGQHKPNLFLNVVFRDMDCDFNISLNSSLPFNKHIIIGALES